MDTYNPIIDSREFKMGFMGKVPPAEDGQVVILSRGKHAAPLFVITEDQNPEARAVRRKACDWQTFIDTAEHAITVEFEPKAKDRVSRFHVCLAVQAKVVDPMIVYRDQITDASQYVRQNLEYMIEEEACGINIEDEAHLKRALYDRLKGYMDIGGMSVYLKGITVDMDSDTKQHYAAMVDVDRKKEIHLKTQESAIEIGKNLNGDVGALMEILEGTRPASEITDVRRKLKKDETDDVIEEVTKTVELLSKLMESGALSEKDGQKAMKEMIPKLGIVSQANLEAAAAEEFAPLDGDEEN